MKKYVIIVAGGQGTRMGAGLPKQFLMLNGRPVLFHTLERFAEIADAIILVLPAEYTDYWQNECREMGFQVPHRVVAGGSIRTESVRNGLNALEGDGLVAIHDAVRPLISKTLINRLFEDAGLYGNAIPVTEIRESLRIRQGEWTQAVDRSNYLAVQTPQCFRLSTIREAYATCEGVFTDDAMVAEAAGIDIHTVPGDPFNIKITYPEDMLFAEAFLSKHD